MSGIARTGHAEAVSAAAPDAVRAVLADAPCELVRRTLPSLRFPDLTEWRFRLGPHGDGPRH